MQFNTYLFGIFFAWVLAVHYSPLPWSVRKKHLLAASYLFYAAWDPPLVLLLWLSTGIDWYAARAIAAAVTRQRRRLMLVVSLVVNLGLLAYFKYGGFLLENFAHGLDALGIEWSPAAPSIILPIGISFYTFETLSYTIDVYRGHCKPFRSFVDYALFLSFFPHLIAGPILRPVDIVPQFAEPRRASRTQFGWGLAMIVLGIFEKNVIADGLLAPAADKAFATDVGTIDAAAAWLGTLAFSGQIFCDFAGYSTSAIGAALCLGFHFPDNFRFPYAAIGFSDFWRRWHISLSSWLRDYLYVPLGGNRKGITRTHINLMATMLIGGLWHGASWTFVAWGGLHGLYLVGERVIRARVKPSPLWSSLPARLLLAAVTFALVSIAWTFFRAQSFDQAFGMVGAMVGLGGAASDVAFTYAEKVMVLVPIVGILAAHWLLRDVSLERAVERCPWPVRSALLAAIIIAIACMPGTDRAFLYFQF
jgi:alginate O-acetyltransferase complex protein AlgI